MAYKALYNVAGGAMRFGNDSTWAAIGSGNNYYGSIGRNLIFLTGGSTRYYVLQRHYTLPSVRLFYSDDLGASWNGPHQADTIALNTVRSVDMAADSEGNIHAAWQAQRASDGTERVYYRKWIHKDAAWGGAAETLASGALTGANLNVCGISVNEDDLPFIAFQENLSTIYGTKYPFGSFLSFNPGNVLCTLAVEALGSDFHVCYHNRSAGSAVAHQKYDPSTDTWSLIDADIFGYGIYSGWVYWSLAKKAPGLIAAGCTPIGGGAVIFNQYAGGSWGASETIWPAYQEDINIGHWHDSIYVATWQAGAEQDQRIWVRTTAPVTWIPAEIITGAVGQTPFQVVDVGVEARVPGGTANRVISIL